MVVEDRFAGALAERARACADTNTLRQATLAEIAEWLPFDSAIFLSPRLGDAPASINKEAFRCLYWNYARNPERYRKGLAKGTRAADALGGAHLDTEVFSADERRDLPLYAEMVRPQGIASQIVARPTFHGRSTGMLFLCRHGAGRFRPCDLDRMLKLLPIIALSHAAVDASSTAAAPEGGDAIDQRATLTAREHEIVELVRRGLTNGEIAAVLGNRPNTVRNQVASIFKKLEVASRAELAGLAGASRTSP